MFIAGKIRKDYKRSNGMENNNIFKQCKNIVSAEKYNIFNDQAVKREI